MVHKQQLERASNSGKRDVVPPLNAFRHWHKVCWRLASDWVAGAKSSHHKQVWAGPSRAALGQDQVACVLRCAVCGGTNCNLRQRVGLDPIEFDCCETC